MSGTKQFATKCESNCIARIWDFQTNLIQFWSFSTNSCNISCLRLLRCHRCSLQRPSEWTHDADWGSNFYQRYTKERRSCSVRACMRVRALIGLNGLCASAFICRQPTMTVLPQTLKVAQRVKRWGSVCLAVSVDSVMTLCLGSWFCDKLLQHSFFVLLVLFKVTIHTCRYVTFHSSADTD